MITTATGGVASKAIATAGMAQVGGKFGPQLSFMKSPTAYGHFLENVNLKPVTKGLVGGTVSNTTNPGSPNQ